LTTVFLMKSWGNIDISKANTLEKALKDRYLNLSIGKQDSSSIYSFHKDKTKGVLYEKKIDDKTIQVKIFYYSINLFSMLFND